MLEASAIVLKQPVYIYSRRAPLLAGNDTSYNTAETGEAETSSIKSGSSSSSGNQQSMAEDQAPQHTSGGALPQGIKQKETRSNGQVAMDVLAGPVTRVGLAFVLLVMQSYLQMCEYLDAMIGKALLSLYLRS